MWAMAHSLSSKRVFFSCYLSCVLCEKEVVHWLALSARARNSSAVTAFWHADVKFCVTAKFDGSMDRVASPGTQLLDIGSFIVLFTHIYMTRASLISPDSSSESYVIMWRSPHTYGWYSLLNLCLSIGWTLILRMNVDLTDERWSYGWTLILRMASSTI